jgi:hypothetical protein
VTSRLHAHGTIGGAVIIASLLTAWFGYVAVDSVLDAIDPNRIDPTFARGALSFTAGTDTGGAAANASAIIGLVIGIVVLLSTTIVIGLVFRGEWAREAGLVIYGVLGLLASAAAMGGLAADPPAPSAWFGLGVGLANFAIVGLLLAPATARSFRDHSRRSASRSG